MNSPETNPQKDKLRVLNLEDSPNDSELIQAELETEWQQVEFLRVDTRQAFIQAMDEFKPEVILSDFKLPDINGHEALKLARQNHPDIPVIMVTGALGDIEAVDLVKLGAKDYVMKDHLQRLTTAVQSALLLEQGIRARKSIESALRESEQQFRTLADSGQALIWQAGTDKLCYYFNQVWLNFTGRPLEKEVGNGWAEGVHPDDLQRCIDIYVSSFDRREKFSMDYRLLRHDGEYRWIQDDGCPRYDHKGSFIGYIGYCLDITERKQAEAKIQRLSQLYLALSHCNKAIVHSKTEQELFASICQTAVRFGGFKMAWIGMIDPVTRMVKPLASFGVGAEEYLHDIKISVDAASEYGQGPTGLALRENQPFWCQDFLRSPLTAPWHERGAALGWGSSAALPLHRGEITIGSFTLYSSEPNAFDEAARELLIEMSTDISFALDNFQHEVERKQTEESLHKLSQAVEQSPNSIVITDLDANLEYVNEAFVKATGYSRAEAIGQNPRILHSGKNPREIYDDMWAHLSRGESWKGELINRRKDGSEYLEAIFASPVRDTNGHVTHYLAIKEDITQRKHIEKSLIESEEKFRIMSASAQDGIVMADSDGNISFWNKAAEKIFGYAELEAMGKSLHRLIAPARFHETFIKGFAHFQQSGEGAVVGKTLELTARHKNGNEFPIELSLSAVKISGLWQAIGIVRDITERKQIEAQVVSQYEHVAGINEQLMQANKQLEQAKSQLLQSEKMAAIGLLAAGVAHEINNPVGYVNSNLGTLEKYLADIFGTIDKYEAAATLLDANNPLVEDLQQYKSKIDLNYIREDTKSLISESHQGLERVKKIVLDLKEFSHADTEDQWVWADVHQGLDSTLNVVWNELKYKCEVIKEYGILPKIYHLPSQLNQVFMNLLVNAAQAIEIRGKITLRTGQEGDKIWIEVSDTGKGIPAANFPHLFDPFFTTKPVGKGTGLGLSVSYKIIEKHHGKIEVQSEVGKGSTFRVWLPVNQPGTDETQ